MAAKPLAMARALWLSLLAEACTGISISDDVIEFRLIGLFRRRLPLAKISKLILRRSTCFIRVKRDTHTERRTSVIFMSAQGPMMLFRTEHIGEFMSEFKAVAPHVILACKPRRRFVFELL